MTVARKFKNKNLPRGILVDRGYVFVRIFPNGRKFQKCIGPLSSPGIIDLAIAKLNEYREQIRTNRFGLDEHCQRITIEQACKLYWDLHGSKRETASDYDRTLRRVKAFWAGRYVDTITYLDVENFRAWRSKMSWKGKMVGPASVNRDHTIITALFNKLREWKRIKAIADILLPADNPGAGVKRPSEKAFTRRRVLSIEEFERLIHQATLRVRRICLGALNTTLRLKDLKLMTKANVVLVNNQLEGEQAKTNKPYAIPINSVMAKLIETAEREHIFDFSNFRKEFDAAVKAANIKGFQFRDLRRTGATIMLKKGMDIATVSKVLGHASIQMTERYLHTTREEMQKAVDILGSLFDEKPEAPKSSRETVVKTVVGDSGKLA